MCKERQIKICSLPYISAIYYALLQSGYEYYSAERTEEHIEMLRSFILPDYENSFFNAVKQNSCEVYPYWPRAAILETASFYIKNKKFNDFDALYDSVMSASNIFDNERTVDLWKWIDSFPNAITLVMNSPNFKEYLQWESSWIDEQNTIHIDELEKIKVLLTACKTQFNSKISEIKIVVNPIKCVYSADYHIVDNCFIYSGGRFQANSIIHEFLHHIVHPEIVLLRDKILQANHKYPVDKSYFLDGNDLGLINAFEEYAVRQLTNDILNGKVPNNLLDYLKELM